VRAPEPGEGRWHERRERGGEAAEAQPPVPPPGDLAQLLLGAVDAREDQPGVPGQRMAGLGQLDGPRAALDQGQPDLALERRDVLAHGGLRHVQRLGRGREGAAPGHLGEHSEAPHIEHQCDL
jgi:hypothetical protein